MATRHGPITEGAEPKHVQLRAELAGWRHRARARQCDPLRARADGDVCRVARHRAPGHRGARRRGCAPPRAGQGHVRRSTPRAVAPPPRLVHPGHAPPWKDSVDARPPGRARSPAGGRRRLVRARPGRRPGGSSACAWPRASRWRSRPAGTPRLLPDLAATTSAGRSTSCSRREYGLAVDTADQTVRAEAADDDLARHLTSSVGDPVLAFERSQPLGGAPLERVISHYRGDRYELHISLDSTMPAGARTPPVEGTT